ncbi:MULTISPECIES: tetratricopeptide repeat protein [Roseobacteraceae]|uniref:Tetratricopeptide repeat-like domain protein n=1 Tax=Pseudosulfitobacter pseudonitzschiae TaxID=1402135 RepID=A0A221JZ52_9RHOB|nr:MULTISPECIES: tetratricopeptide repeat protein [Roseobacteraceae]ASM71857.1 tetratricopeptide repeat-like domain protein [Pseudosulfitobacter pseudonitzschiae]
MSNNDSFIDEVNDEVRRDRLYGMLRRYGWIAVLVIVLIVGGAAFTEWRKAQTRAEAEALGDAMLSALKLDDSAARAAAFSEIETGQPSARAVLNFLTASEEFEAGNVQEANAQLQEVANNNDVPLIYRQIASFKILGQGAATMSVEDRRAGYEALAQPGVPLRLLATEQLAMIDVETGDTDAAIARLKTILDDSEVTPDLQQRALQVIVALGGEPDLGANGANGN